MNAGSLIFLIIEEFDSSSSVWESARGRKKLCPGISPKQKKLCPGVSLKQKETLPWNQPCPLKPALLRSRESKSLLRIRRL